MKVAKNASYTGYLAYKSKSIDFDFFFSFSF